MHLITPLFPIKENYAIFPSCKLFCRVTIAFLIEDFLPLLVRDKIDQNYGEFDRRKKNVNNCHLTVLINVLEKQSYHIQHIQIIHCELANIKRVFKQLAGQIKKIKGRDIQTNTVYIKTLKYPYHEYKAYGSN